MALEQPHDKFFKETFSRPEILTDFVQAFLPERLVERLDFQTLQRENETYLGEDLSEYYVDLLFSVQYGSEKIRLVLLFEHKSYPEEYPHFQLNQYLLNYWNRQIKAREPLTPIVPIVVYHGYRVWKKQPVAQYFPTADALLAPYLPSFDYELINLKTTTEAALSQLRTDYARLTALLLQNSRNQQRLLRVFEDFAQLFERLAQDNAGRGFIETSFLYVYWTTDLTKQQLIAIFHKISRQTGEAAMTTAERLINEGIEKGIEKGMERGIQKGIAQANERHVLGLLKLGMDANTISVALDLPLPTVQEIIRRVNP